MLFMFTLVGLVLIELITPVQMVAALGDVNYRTPGPLGLIPIVNRFYAGIIYKEVTVLINAVAYILTLVLCVFLYFAKPEFMLKYSVPILVVTALVLINLVWTWFYITYMLLSYGKLPWESNFKFIIMSIIFPYGVAYALTFNGPKLRAEERRRRVLKDGYRD